jgi:hypothetical protein
MKSTNREQQNNRLLKAEKSSEFAGLSFCMNFHPAFEPILFLSSNKTIKIQSSLFAEAGGSHAEMASSVVDVPDGYCVLADLLF